MFYYLQILGCLKEVENKTIYFALKILSCVFLRVRRNANQADKLEHQKYFKILHTFALHIHRNLANAF
jgi:hypothetical protein